MKFHRINVQNVETQSQLTETMQDMPTTTECIYAFELAPLRMQLTKKVIKCTIALIVD